MKKSNQLSLGIRQHAGLCCRKGLEANEPSRHCSGPMLSRAAHATTVPAWRTPRQGNSHHYRGHQCTVSIGSCKPAIQRRPAQPTVGVRLHVWFDLARLAIRGVCHRCRCRRILGWRQRSPMRTDFVLDALEQALYERQRELTNALIHHSDRGSQYVSIRCSERLAEAGIELSMGSRGESYGNALAETNRGLCKAELIHRRAPRKTKASLELATLEWVSWFNHHRLLESIGFILPTEAKENYYRYLNSQAAIPA